MCKYAAAGSSSSEDEKRRFFRFLKMDTRGERTFLSFVETAGCACVKFPPDLTLDTATKDHQQQKEEKYQHHQGKDKDERRKKGEKEKEGDRSTTTAPPPKKESPKDGPTPEHHSRGEFSFYNPTLYSTTVLSFLFGLFIWLFFCVCVCVFDDRREMIIGLPPPPISLSLLRCLPLCFHPVAATISRFQKPPPRHIN